MEQWLDKINSLKTWQVSIIVAVVGFAVFFTGLTNPFMHDDIGQIVNNPVVHSVTNIRLFFEGSTFYNGHGISPLSGIYYRPLMTTMFSLLYTLFGPHTVYFHVVQLLLCMGSTILLYLVFRYSFAPSLALLLSLVFLVHPINSQVAYAIPTMQDALFFFFGILAFWLLLRLSSTRSLLPVAMCLTLSLLSKEAAVLFVVVSLLYLFWFDRKRLLPFIGMMALPVSLYLTLKIHAVGLSAHSNIAPIDNLSVAGRLLTAPSIVLFYIFKLVYPWKLASVYQWTYPHFSFSHVLLPLVIDLLVIAALTYLAKIIRSRVSKALYYTYLFFAVWCALGLLIYLQLVPLDATANEAWFYFPMAGVLGMAGVVIVAFQNYVRPASFFVVALLIISLLGLRTDIRGLDWSNETRLALHDIAASKEDYIAYDTMSDTLIEQGDVNSAKVFTEQSINIEPSFNNNYNLGVILARQGDYAGAMKAYNTAIKYGGSLRIYYGIAELSLVYGNYSVYKQWLLNSLANFPQDSTLWMYLAVLEDGHNDNAEAKVAIAKAASYGLVQQSIYSSIMSNQPFSVTLAVSGKTVFIQ